MKEAWRHKIKEQTLQLTLLYCGRTARSSHRRFCFIKKRPQHRCFPVNIAKFSRLLISKNICQRLLFDCFNGSLLHEPKGSRSRLYDGVRLQSLSQRSSFLFFKSASLVLNGVPTCDRKSKTITFHESIKFFYWLFLVVLDGFRSF